MDDFEKLLERCLEAASALRTARREQTLRRKELLAAIYRTAYRAKFDPAPFLKRARKRGLAINAATKCIFAVLLKLVLADFGTLRKDIDRDAAALRYLRSKKLKPKDVVSAIGLAGGVRACADRVRKKNGSEASALEQTPADIWKKLRARHARVLEAPNFKAGVCIALGEVESGRFSVRSCLYGEQADDAVQKLRRVLVVGDAEG